MFDKLIESDTNTAEQNGRNKYFIASTLVVGTLFLTAVVFSLYAANIDIGGSDLDMVRILAPELADTPKEPEPEKVRPAAAPIKSDSPVTTRNSNIQNINETIKIPDGVSVVKNTSRERPENGRWNQVPGLELDGGSQRNAPGGQIGATGNSDNASSTKAFSERVTKLENTTPPPPVIKAPPTQSLGVINGKATSLPIPVYPQTAKVMGVSGDVNVQVTIDEEGRVISAKPVSGHQLLRGEAQKAALRAKFSPTFLSNQKVKVTGVIVYKFKN